MSDLKTKPTGEDVEHLIDAIEDDTRRSDCRTVMNIMREATGEEPRIWGSGMVGFGSYHYKYESGREGDWFLTGFASRKSSLTLYVMAGFDRYDTLMKNLGSYKTGKSCLYVKRLEDVDEEVLRELVQASVEHMKKTYPVD